MKTTDAMLLAQVLPGIDQARYEYVLGGLLGLRSEEERAELNKHQVIVLCVIDWLAHMGFDTSQQDRVVAFMPDDASKVISVTVSDGRYVTMSEVGVRPDQRRAFDLHTNETMAKWPRSATHFVADVQELYRRLIDTAERVLASMRQDGG